MGKNFIPKSSGLLNLMLARPCLISGKDIAARETGKTPRNKYPGKLLGLCFPERQPKQIKATRLGGEDSKCIINRAQANRRGVDLFLYYPSSPREQTFPDWTPGARGRIDQARSGSIRKAALKLTE